MVPAAEVSMQLAPPLEIPAPTTDANKVAATCEAVEVTSDNDDESQSRSRQHTQDAVHDTRHPSDEKYRLLKRKLKAVLEENERLGAELDKSSRRARDLRHEKNLLLDRLCAQELGSDSSLDTLSSMDSDSELSDASLARDNRSRRTSPVRAATLFSPQKRLRVPSKDVDAVSLQTARHNKKSISKPLVRKSLAAAARKEPKEASSPSTITNVGSATQKPKRIHSSGKHWPNLSKVRKVQHVERDDEGHIKFPLTVGIITIMDIGYVVFDREAFHNERYIWPVGYKMSRSYNSMIDPTNLTTYTCSVIDDGEAPKASPFLPTISSYPGFQIDAQDQPGKPIIAGTATGAWTHVVKTANMIRRREHSNSASGPDYFGFSNATIAKIIQDLPNVDKCTSYIMQRFEEASSTKTPVSPDKRKILTLGSSAADKVEDEDNTVDEAEDELNEDMEEEGEGREAYTSLEGPGKSSVDHLVSPKVHGVVNPAVTAPVESTEDIDVEIQDHSSGPLLLDLKNTASDTDQETLEKNATATATLP
ncbi:hypothetical protein BGZ72_004566 [Mortierella alpina]|nr:hypothetical protein BGZ72_004566 [Mortierella alpina]